MYVLKRTVYVTCMYFNRQCMNIVVQLLLAVEAMFVNNVEYR